MCLSAKEHDCETKGSNNSTETPTTSPTSAIVASAKCQIIASITRPPKRGFLVVVPSGCHHLQKWRATSKQPKPRVRAVTCVWMRMCTLPFCVDALARRAKTVSCDHPLQGCEEDAPDDAQHVLKKPVTNEDSIRMLKDLKR